MHCLLLSPKGVLEYGGGTANIHRSDKRVWCIPFGDAGEPFGTRCRALFASLVLETRVLKDCVFAEYGVKMLMSVCAWGHVGLADRKVVLQFLGQ